MGVPLSHWELLQCRLVWAYERTLDTPLRRWKYIPSPDVAWLVRRGNVTLEFSSGVEHYAAGTWVFPKKADAIQEFSKDARIMSFRFHIRWASGVPLFDRTQSFSIGAETIPQFTKDAEDLVNVVNNLFPENRTEHIIPKGNLEAYLRIQPLTLRFAANYYFLMSSQGIQANIPTLRDPRVSKALRFLHNHPLNSPLKEPDLATHVGLSVSQLNRLFAREMQTTPATVWNKRRFDSACFLLVQKNHSIKQIAFELGFSSPEHFSSWFRGKCNQSPREYRRQLLDQLH